MKKTLLALALASSFAFADEVTVTGYGSNYNAALENAKVVALEKGASTFIIAESNARNGRVEEKIDQYYFEKNEQSNYSSLTIMTTSSSNLYSPFL